MNCRKLGERPEVLGIWISMFVVDDKFCGIARRLSRHTSFDFGLHKAQCI